MNKKQILVVDDSAFMRKIITDIVNSSESLEVVATARNGQDAIEKIKRYSPDAITLDVEMPVMDGLTALKIIMEEMPLPVIMLSSVTKEGAEATINALEYGALDFITKPSSMFKINTEDVRIELIEKLKIAVNVKVRASRKTAVKEVIKPLPKYESKYKAGGLNKIVAIGTSTGGPKALQEVIPKLPKNLDASILIVQHMPAGFTKSLAERMDKLSSLTVKEAENGDMLNPGVVYIAPGDFHMHVVEKMGKLSIKLEKSPTVSGHRPSVDSMMYSLYELKNDNIIGVIMTGMGADGAKGLAKLKEKGIPIIAQDEESCVVFGMPKSTINLNVVDRIVPLDRIASEIIKAMEV
jgi:two-component system chemotaxis response regulator CheB